MHISHYSNHHQCPHSLHIPLPHTPDPLLHHRNLHTPLPLPFPPAHFQNSPVELSFCIVVELFNSWLCLFYLPCHETVSAMCKTNSQPFWQCPGKCHHVPAKISGGTS